MILDSSKTTEDNMESISIWELLKDVNLYVVPIYNNGKGCSLLTMRNENGKFKFSKYGWHSGCADRIKEVQESGSGGPVTNVSTSAMLTAEITLISSVLVALIMLRLVNNVLMIVAVLAVLFAAVLAMPIMPRLKSEMNDSLYGMTFYVVLALVIVITLFYWGSLNV